MKKFILALLFASTIISFAEEIPHYDIKAEFFPETSKINVEVDIRFNGATTREFVINSNLQLSDYEGFEIRGNVENGITNAHKIELLNEDAIRFVYDGIINDSLDGGAVEYARGFSTTSGAITPGGVFLSGATYWLPQLGNNMFTYDMTITSPADWKIVSQGIVESETEIDGKNVTKIKCVHPMEEAYLVSYKFHFYEENFDGIDVQAYLREPDSSLAMKYIKATEGYLKMYNEMLGDYPFEKFALVENYWETGFGMPSFTLLGSKVIRFPFILYTSYPHELLHNWWGNGVYVDFQRGNWCEGLTAYLADHELKMMKGEGAEYRKNTLEKFTSYVTPENDFPVDEFRSRNNPAEEAIGYGKCLMGFHMLKNKLGDDTFNKSLRRLYSDYKFRQISFEEIQETFESVSNEELQAYFEQWFRSEGAPELKFRKTGKNGVEISQAQDGDKFSFDLYAEIYSGGEKRDTIITVTSGNQLAKFPDNTDKVVFDPRYDLMRRLDPGEIPPTLNEMFGAKEAIAFIAGDEGQKAAGNSLAETWKGMQQAQGKDIEIIIGMGELPEDDGKPVWVFNSGEAKNLSGLISELYSDTFSDEELKEFDSKMKSGSSVAVLNLKGRNYCFINTESQAAAMALARKLPHYGKYSYLAFDGDAADNKFKGIFPALHNPMEIRFK
jgi:aminopeptidase N